MNSFEDLLKVNRPKITPISVKNYLSALKRLSKTTGIKLTEPKDIIENKDVILKHILGLNISNRKKTISALVGVLLGENCPELLNELRLQLYKDIKEVEEDADSQLLTPTQEANYIPWDKVLEVYHELERICKPLWKKELVGWDRRSFETLQDYVLLSLYVLMPPRRSEDYCAFKIKNFDDKTVKSKDNYMVIPKNKKKLATFVFNKYKNASRLGQQVIEIPNSLKKIILQWNEINKADYLIVNSRGNPVGQQGMTKMLNRILAEGVSSTMLRHSFMTAYPPTKDLKEMAELAKKMGNASFESILKYSRKTDEVV